MKVLQQGNWKKDISIPDLLERKGCDEFSLLEAAYELQSDVYEVWWYAYKGANHILAKRTTYPYPLSFFLLEPGDLFRMEDFPSYVERTKVGITKTE